MVQRTRVAPTLVIGDLTLRPLVEDDAPEIESLINGHDALQMVFETSDHLSGSEWLRDRFKRQDLNVDPLSPFGFYDWAVVKTDTDSLVGAVVIDKIAFNTPGELTILIAPNHRGQGYGRQVVDEVARWVFVDLIPGFAIKDGADAGLRPRQLTALVRPDNAASIAMLRGTRFHDAGLVEATNREKIPVQVVRFDAYRADFLPLEH